MKKYKFLFAISVIAIGLMTVLLASINEKKEEKESLLSVPKIEKWETKNEEFRKFYPREFDSWKHAYIGVFGQECRSSTGHFCNEIF
ncbi:hypothetical protein [Aliarcobacter butzleri]|uniref:hypothetical protein n=1 Tax=Aliarcobacter butzleri TaxID=28197 RepID=UPI002B245F98|nr:hypothetical protein [Aliarcobacter butzleri]